jgi:hypothetical protein
MRPAVDCTNDAKRGTFVMNISVARLRTVFGGGNDLPDPVMPEPQPYPDPMPDPAPIPAGDPPLPEPGEIVPPIHAKTGGDSFLRPALRNL